MEKSISEAIRNLRQHPGEYSLLALVLLITVVALPQLETQHRPVALLSAILAAICAIVVVRLTNKRQEPKGTPVTTFEAREGAKYNYDFYEFFNSKVAAAKEDIYITGDGFECADQEGLRLAREFSNSFRYSLEKGVNVVRVQTRPRANAHWAKMLADLVDEYPERFQLFVLKDQGLYQMSSVCVIDPEEQKTNVVELMISTEKLFGVQAASLAGTAVFIEGRGGLAKDLRERIRSLCRPDYTVHCSTGKDTLNLLVGREYYFAFGSNMFSEQMKERCPSAEKVGVGVLLDHRLVFNRRGTYRSGGVASVEGAHGERVYGVIYTLDPMDLRELDKREDPAAYRRIRELVRTLDGQEALCHLYKALPQGNFRPDADYLDQLLTAAQENGLPMEYVEQLRRQAENGA